MESIFFKIIKNLESNTFEQLISLIEYKWVNKISMFQNFDIKCLKANFGSYEILQFT